VGALLVVILAIFYKTGRHFQEIEDVMKELASTAAMSKEE
jgi:hypothetical protein